MNNKPIRRLYMRKFVKHYGNQNTRKMTDIFSKAYHTSKQRIAGNLKTMKYDECTISIDTYIPNCYSVMS